MNLNYEGRLTRLQLSLLQSKSRENAVDVYKSNPILVRTNRKNTPFPWRNEEHRFKLKEGLKGKLSEYIFIQNKVGI